MGVALHVLQFPNPIGCNLAMIKELKELLVDCTIFMNHEISKWAVTYQFAKPNIHSCSSLQHYNVVFHYDVNCSANEKKESYLVDKILADWSGLIKMYQHAHRIDDTLAGLVHSDVYLKI